MRGSRSYMRDTFIARPSPEQRGGKLVNKEDAENEREREQERTTSEASE